MSWSGGGRRAVEAELRRIAGLEDRAIELAPAALALAALERTAASLTPATSSSIRT